MAVAADLDAIRNMMVTVADQIDSDDLSSDAILSIIENIIEMLAESTALEDINIDDVVWNNLREIEHRVRVENARDVTVFNHGVGRPSLEIPVSTIQVFVQSGLLAKYIAGLLGVSISSIRRRMRQHGLRHSDMYSVISDNDLDALVNEIHQNHPNAGYKMMLGHMRSKGIRVQEYSLQGSLRRLDPEGTFRRLSIPEGIFRRLSIQISRRRRYSVPSPNSLWHIDGNHKLTRWRIVVHGGIDGFSRLIVFLSAASNNTASTVLESFLVAVQLYGTPSRVRTDKGRENIEVAHYMVQVQGVNRNSHFTGRSVHNQRIERLWRDVYENVLDLFYTMSSHLESEGLLNPDREIDLFALHRCFLPHIQRHLQLFKEAWNQHGLRTAGNQSPLQLWLLNQREGADPPQVDEDYGVDWEGPHNHHTVGVTVPEVQLSHPLSRQELAALPNPDVPFCHVLSLYFETVHVLMAMLEEHL